MSETNIVINYPDDYDTSREATELKPLYERLSREQLKIEKEISDEAERRTALQDIHKKLIRAAFFTHPDATEEDFQRLWPRLRDDELCEHTDTVYRQTIEALRRDFDRSKSQEDLEANEESQERRQEITSTRKFYVGYLIMKDKNAGEHVGSVKAMLAESEEEVISNSLTGIQQAAPDADLEHQAEGVQEVPRSLLENAAREILGWSPSGSK